MEALNAPYLDLNWLKVYENSNKISGANEITRQRYNIKEDRIIIKLQGNF